jgi:hypothetical protein
LKYFVRLPVIGGAYCYFCALTLREFSVRFVACRALPPWAIHEGKMISERFRWGRTDVTAADAHTASLRSFGNSSVTILAHDTTFFLE